MNQSGKLYLAHPYLKVAVTTLAALMVLLWTGLPAAAQQSFELADDLELRFDSGQISADGNRAHIFDVQLLHEGVPVGRADELRLHQTRSDDGTIHIIHDILIRNLSFSLPDEDASLEFGLFEATELVISRPPPSDLATAEEITSYFSAVRPPAARLSDAFFVTEEDGIFMSLGQAELSSRHRQGEDGASFQADSRLHFSQIAIGPLSSEDGFNGMPDVLKMAGIDMIEAEFSVDMDMMFSGQEFELVLTSNLSANQLFELNLAASALMDRAVLRESAVLDDLSRRGNDDAYEAQLARIMGLTSLTSADIRLADNGIVEMTGLALFAPFIQLALVELSAEIAAMASQPVSDFFTTGGSLTISAAPNRPVNLIQMGVLGIAPDLAIDLLGLSVRHER